MRILYVHQYFTTPEKGGGTRSYFVAQEMISRGHEVTMLTSDTSGGERRRVDIDGIDVIKLPCRYDNRSGALGRIRSYWKFVKEAKREMKKLPKYDLMFATSTPLTVGYIAKYGLECLHLPYIFEVRDLWPEFPIQMGAIKSKLAIKYLRQFERSIYDHACGIVTLSPGMEEGVRKTGTTCPHITMVPNMSKPDIFYPRKYNEELAHRFGLREDAFKVIYFGSLGRANDIPYVLDAANLLYREQENVQFVFLGTGIGATYIAQYNEGRKNSNVIYLGTHNTYETSEVANCCQVSLTTFLDLPVLYTNSPNKLFDSLSAGLPIIVNSNGWTRKMVEDYQCGFYVDPKAPEDLVNRIKQLKSDTTLRNTFSKNARELSLTTYDKTKLCGEVVDFVEMVTKE